MNVFACMPQLKLLKGLVNRELYVISLASDLRGQSNHREAAVGSGNRTLPAISPAVDAAMKYFVIGASNIFHKIDKNQPVQLGGDGIVLYPPSDPNGMLALHVVVVESDDGIRRSGELLEGVFEDASVKKTMKEIASATGAAGPIPAALLTAAMAAATSVIPKLLKQNKDDILMDIAFSGRSISKYHGTSEGREHPFANKQVETRIQVFVE